MLENKVVVITGSGQGIGKHAAMTFAKEKAKVVIADFNADLAKKTATELSALTETMAIHADVREEESVKQLIDQVIGRFGQIDVMMNNAAIVPHFAWNIPRWPLIADMPLEFWDRVVKTNLYGTFFGTKHAIPHMAKRKSGHIINLYGGGGVKPGGAGTYMVTKDGIRTFSRYVAEEVRDCEHLRRDVFAAGADRHRDGAGGSDSAIARPGGIGHGIRALRAVADGAERQMLCL